MSKKVLIPGGTGAMGVYLVPELLNLGYEVDVISLDEKQSDNQKLRYFKADAKDAGYIEKILENGYDAVVDFMIYPTKEEYETFIPLYLKNTEHYIFLSTYRVYANEEHPIRETSPRLLDASKDQVLLTSGDYCIYKAQSEEFLRTSGYSNWTAIRAAITYYKRRFQLITMEYNLVVRRMMESKTLVLPEPAMNIEATMSWAGDVAKMIAGLVLNPSALREIYSVCTAEHHTWRDIAEMYSQIGELKYITVDTDTFLNIISPGNIYARQQLIYDRYFDRIMDNSKILEITGMKQSELMPLREGLEMELSALKKENIKWQSFDGAYNRMDEYLAQIGLK